MALLFTLLLASAALALLYFNYEAKVALSTFIRNTAANQTQAKLVLPLLSELKYVSFFVLFMMLIVVLVSFLISTFVVTRINRISETAKDIIDANDLSRRISVDSRWDDLSNLAHTLNVFLDWIEALVQGIRNVGDNIAHDLRTPLTHMRNQLEVLNYKTVTDADIKQMLAESDRLLALFGSLLRIANVEKGQRHQRFKRVDINSLINDVLELYEPVAEEKCLAIDTQMIDDAYIDGDRDLLFQLFTNLLDNAVKFSESDGSLMVTIVNKNKVLEVIVADRGIGLEATEINKVFDRFYRVKQSCGREGSGLGLSLVKAIVDLHKGTIELIDNSPGLKVIVRFPRYHPA